jgi:hypothetical protein
MSEQTDATEDRSDDEAVESAREGSEQPGDEQAGADEPSGEDD